MNKLRFILEFEFKNIKTKINYLKQLVCTICYCKYLKKCFLYIEKVLILLLNNSNIKTFYYDFYNIYKTIQYFKQIYLNKIYSNTKNNIYFVYILTIVFNYKIHL